MIKTKLKKPVDKTINPNTGVNDKRMINFFKAILSAYMALPKKERDRVHAAVGVFLK